MAESLRRRSARLGRVLTALLVVMALLLVGERYSALVIRAMSQGTDAAWMRDFGLALIATVPDVCYLLALAGIRRALGAIARGERYGAAVTAALSRVGLLLAAGAFFALAIAPGLAKLVGAGPGYLIAYDPGAVALVALGLALTVLARILDDARALERELDEIF
jgi:hypothetical protein